MKPVIRIRLVPNMLFDTYKGRVTNLRKQGTDTWQATLTLTTSEGHVTMHKFSDSSKEVALNGAYDWLKQYSIAEWFPKFSTEMCEKYADFASADTAYANEFTYHLGLVERGKIPTETFIRLWDGKVAKHSPVYLEVPVIKKWKWYHWFWNPQD